LFTIDNSANVTDATDTLTVGTPVPSLGPWGLLVLAVLLLLLSAGHLTRRSTPAV
jgi:hypothetical protein